MKRIWSVLIALALIPALVPAGAEEAGVRYSPRFLAVNAAQHALTEKYAVPEGMNAYFMRTVSEEADGSFQVVWEPDFGDAAISWLLGTYKAEVRGERVEITWSHEGEETYGGYDAPAWGALQLRDMAEEVRTGFTMENSWDAAESSIYAGRTGYPFSGRASDFDDTLREEALARAALTPEQADELARLALREIYGALEWWRLETTDMEFGWDVGMLNGRPAVAIHYDLWGQGREDWEWQEGDGAYTVTVNLATGEIEEILYTSNLSGNG